MTRSALRNAHYRKVEDIKRLKHGAEAHPAQRHHLLDADKLVAVETRYGTIQRRCVLYRGDAQELDGVAYENVEDYLRSLGGPLHEYA